MTPLGGLFILTVASFLAWAPLFGFAYSRRQFGGSSRGYTIAWIATSLVTIAVFALMSVVESASR